MKKKITVAQGMDDTVKWFLAWYGARPVAEVRLGISANYRRYLPETLRRLKRTKVITETEEGKIKLMTK